MAGTIIGIVIFALVSSIFIVLGIVQYRSKIPVSINTGEKPPREDELTDMTEWNHKPIIWHLQVKKILKVLWMLRF